MLPKKPSSLWKMLSSKSSIPSRKCVKCPYLQMHWRRLLRAVCHCFLLFLDISWQNENLNPHASTIGSDKEQEDVNVESDGAELSMSCLPVDHCQLLISLSRAAQKRIAFCSVQFLQVWCQDWIQWTTQISLLPVCCQEVQRQGWGSVLPGLEGPHGYIKSSESCYQMLWAGHCWFCLQQHSVQGLWHLDLCCLC